MRFEFSTAGKIIFGCSVLAQIPSIAAYYGNKVILVASSSISNVVGFRDSLIQAGFRVSLIRTHGEPSVSSIRGYLSMVTDEKCDLVIGFGGGSAIDAGKVISALATNPGDILEYLEVIGRGKQLVHPPIPYIAIPTTSGTGSEVTRNAVLESTEHCVKVSLRSHEMIPKVAVIDPELTYSIPAEITANTGLDTLTQLIEPFVSRLSNPITDMYCIEGMKKVTGSLLNAYLEGRNKKAREDMSLASLLSGMALANAGLGAIHGFAGPIGGMFSVPHGAICATLLPHVMKVNVDALRNQSKDHPFLKRYQKVAQILTNESHATIDDGIQWIENIVIDLKIASLTYYGLVEDDFTHIIDKARVSNSMKGNPINLSESDMRTILARAL